MKKRVKWCTQCDYTTEDLLENICPVCNYKPRLIEIKKEK